MARGTGLHSSLAIISSHDGFLSLEDFRMINNAHFFADDRKYQKLVSLQESGGAPSKKSVYQLLRKKEKIVIPSVQRFCAMVSNGDRSTLNVPTSAQPFQ